MEVVLEVEGSQFDTTAGSAWQVRCGFSFDRPRFAAERLRHGKTTQPDRHRNGEREGQGGTNALVQKIIPFDAVWPVLSR